MSPDNSAPVEHPAQLDQQFAGGLAWTAAAKWISQLVSWPSVIITARWLSPADFGVVDMAGFYFTLTNVLAEFGIGTAILQMREIKDETMTQVNSVSLMFGVAACGVTLAVAPLLSQFFSAPQLTLMTRIASVSFIMIALQVVPIGMMQRAMDYRRLSLTEAVQAVVQALTTVGGALLGMGYWSLVAGGLAGRAASVVMVLCWQPVAFARPHWKSVVEPIRFGTEIAFQRMAWMLYLQSDAIVVGRMMGQSILGTYRMAISLASAPADKIGMLVMRVTAPLFARLQNDRKLMRRYLLILTEVLALALIPLVAGLIVVAPEAVQFLLGSNWDGAVAPLRWLALFTVIRTLGSLGSQALLALRLQRFNSWMVTVNVIVMPVAFYIASFQGSGFVAAAWVLMSPVTSLPPLLKLLKELECGKRKYLGALLPALTASAAMVGVVMLVKIQWLEPWSPLAKLGLEVPLGGAVYGGMLLAFFRTRVMQYVRFVLELRKSPDKVAVEIP